MDQIAPIEVGLVVEDLDRMLAFYTNVLSCTEVRRADIPPALSGAIKTAPDGYVNVWLKTPNNEVIKLVAPPAPPQRVSPPQFSSDRTGYCYLTFYCTNIEQAVDKAEESGAKIRSEPSTLSGEIGVKLVFFEDPEGNVIELVEPAAAQEGA